MMLLEQVERYVTFKRNLGFKYETELSMLRCFATWAMQRGDRFFVRIKTVLEWSSMTESSNHRCRRLRTVRLMALWLHAEDSRHEVPHPDAAGRNNNLRRTPHLLSAEQIRMITDAALQLPPTGSIRPQTYHYMIGLIAATGLRRSEACRLRLEDLTEDGLIIRQTKFGKSRLVALHPTTRQALTDYLALDCRPAFYSDSLFVLHTGRAPAPVTLSAVFTKLARQVGLRSAKGRSGPILHDLRHVFAVNSLASAIATDRERISRHMLALSTYMGHVSVASTYWYLEASPQLLRQIADVAQHAYQPERCES